ncbi:MAG: DNA/RNA non-specific endonuclease [Rhodospirillales bacterium]|nr:DNA/RNA non-specific endonuclease [Rhodospirillales bacterium]
MANIPADFDNSKIHPQSKPLEHLIDLFCFNGRPFNKDPDHEVTILVNHGYVVGFSSFRKQPLWAAYRVADADHHVDYDRPQLFYDDERLDEQDRITPATFGKITDPGSGREVQLNRGHLVPNEAINQQFGRLAQMETFFMSNMSPQYARMNQGIWAHLESRILNDYGPAMDHVWVMVGPIFSEDPAKVPEVTRRGGMKIPVPEAYYCILFDPTGYPYYRMGNVEVLALRVPQTDGREQLSQRHITTIDAIEKATKLDFLTKVPSRSEAKAEALTAADIWAPSPRRARRRRGGESGES